MKKIIKYLMIAMVFTMSLLLTAQSAHASGETFIVTNLDTDQTYDTASPISIYDAESEEFGVLDALNNWSTLFTTTEMTATFQADTGKWELSYLSGGSYVTYQTDVFSFIIDGTSVTAETNSGPMVMNLFQVSINKREGISGQENFVTNVEDAKPLSYFLNYFEAWDNVDGDLTSSIYVVTDNYTPNMSVLGPHEVTLGVTDSSSNESTFMFTINVVDITKPVITGNASNVQISYTETFNITSFRSTLVASDNYDTLTNSNIVIKSDGYTANKTNLGTYSIVFEVTDSSGNQATFTKQIEVIDDIPPMFSGPSTITKPTESIVTVNDIKGDLTASDVKDGNRTSFITVKEDNYTGYGTR